MAKRVRVNLGMIKLLIFSLFFSFIVFNDNRVWAFEGEECQAFFKELESVGSRVKVYQKIVEKFNLNSFSKLHQYAVKRYGHQGYGEDLLKRLQNQLGERFAVLIIDSGVVFNIEEFLALAIQLKEEQKEKFNQIGPWDLRDLIAKKMGKVTFYHSKLMTEQSKETILEKTGLLSPIIYNGSDTLSSLVEPIQYQYRKRFFGQTGDNHFLSVTTKDKMGVAVAYANFSMKEGIDFNDYKIYQFKIETSPLNRLWAQEKGPVFYSGSGEIDDHLNLGVIDEALDLEVESFLPLMIEKNEIREVTTFSREQADLLLSDYPSFFK